MLNPVFWMLAADWATKSELPLYQPDQRRVYRGLLDHAKTIAKMVRIAKMGNWC
jgi:hypothetical protein